MCLLGSCTGLSKPVARLGEHLPAALLVTVETHEAGYQQTADDRDQGCAREDHGGQERRGINGHQNTLEAGEDPARGQRADPASCLTRPC
jgi:hypothetical protein